MLKHHRILLAGAAAAALALAGCGPASSGPSQSGTTTGSSQTGLTWEDSPLAKMMASYRSAAFLSQEDMQTEINKYMQKVEEAVATCMADQGFSYIPSKASGNTIQFTTADEGLSPLEFAQQNGYGFTTSFASDPAETPQDPNEAQLKTMSKAERAAWETALLGDTVDAEAEGHNVSGSTGGTVVGVPSQDYDWEKGGCRGKAIHENETDMFSAQSVYDDPQWSELTAKMNKIWEDVNASPELAEASAHWSSCMADSGFSQFKTPDDAISFVAEKSKAAFDPATGAADESALKDLKEEEITIAVADHTCQQKVGLEEARLKKQFALEEEFIATNKEQLEAFLAALGEATKK